MSYKGIIFVLSTLLMTQSFASLSDQRANGHPYHVLCDGSPEKLYTGFVHSQIVRINGNVEVDWDYLYNRKDLLERQGGYMYNVKYMKNNYAKFINGENHQVELARRHMRLYNYSRKHDQEEIDRINANRAMADGFIQDHQAGLNDDLYYTTLVQNINRCNIFRFPRHVMRNYSMAYGFQRGEWLVRRALNSAKRKKNEVLSAILADFLAQVKSAKRDANLILHYSVLLSMDTDARMRHYLWLNKHRSMGEQIGNQSTSPVDFTAAIENPKISNMPQNLIAIRQYLRFLIQAHGSN